MYSFKVEWYDANSAMVKHFNFSYFTDGQIEMVSARPPCACAFARTCYPARRHKARAAAIPV